MSGAAQKSPIAELCATQHGGLRTVRAPYGEITDLTRFLGTESWSFSRILQAESVARQALLNGERVETTGERWSITGLRRVERIPFKKRPSRSGTVLNFLNLESEILDLARTFANRRCPRCKKEQLHADATEIGAKIWNELKGSHIALTAQFTSRARPPELSLSFVGEEVKDSAEGNSAVIDHFTLDDTAAERLRDALKLIAIEKADSYSIFVKHHTHFQLHSSHHLGETCVSCGHNLPRISRTALLQPLGKDHQQIFESFAQGNTTIHDVLRTPLAELARDLNSPHLSLLPALSAHLFSNHISLLSPLSDLSAPQLQRLELLRHSLRGTCQTIIVIEEPFAAANALTADRIKYLLGKLCALENAVLLINAHQPASKDSERVQLSIGTAHRLLTTIEPGSCFVSYRDDPQEINAFLEGPNLRETAQHIVARPKLTDYVSDESTERTVAEATGLLAPLLELYQELPSAKAHGIHGANILVPSFGSPQPKFKGMTLSEVLNLPLQSARELLRHIPRCARALERPFQLGLGAIQLNAHVSTLSLAERNLLLINQLNTRPGKSHRLYHLEFPFAGMTVEQQQSSTVVFAELVRNGHSLFLTDPNTVPLPFPYQIAGERADSA